MHDYNPIEHVSSRVKSPDSLVEKVVRKGIEPDFDSIRAAITDIAGVRITCSFVADVYRLFDLLTAQDDVTVARGEGLHRRAEGERLPEPARDRRGAGVPLDRRVARARRGAVPHDRDGLLGEPRAQDLLQVRPAGAAATARRASRMPPTPPPSSTSAWSGCTANCTVPPAASTRTARGLSARRARRNRGSRASGATNEPVPSADDSTGELDAIAVELYALPPDEFTAARNARAAAADRALAARLKRCASRPPRRGRWTCSPARGSSPRRSSSPARCARRRTTSTRAELARLSRQRRALVAALATQAVDLAARPRRRRQRGGARRRREDDQRGGDGCRGRRRRDDRAPRPPARGVRLRRRRRVGRRRRSLPGVPDAPPPSRDDLAERRARKAAEKAAARGRARGRRGDARARRDRGEAREGPRARRPAARAHRRPARRAGAVRGGRREGRRARPGVSTRSERMPRHAPAARSATPRRPGRRSSDSAGCRPGRALSP